MDESKFRFRKADGSPEPRSVDDVLRDAVRSGEFDNLPGKGRPIDLDDYFSSGPEDRVAHRILKDNEVLPAPLQDRREAEALRQAAETLRQREGRALQAARDDIRRTSSLLTALFPDRQALMGCLGLEAWPACFAEPGEGSLPDLREAVRGVARLRTLVARHNRRIESSVRRYLDLIAQGNACVRRLNNRLASTGSLTVAFQMMAPVDGSLLEQEVRAAFPPLPELSEDAPERVRDVLRGKRKGFWQRIL